MDTVSNTRKLHKTTLSLFPKGITHGFLDAPPPPPIHSIYFFLLVLCSPHVTVAQYTQEEVIPGNQLLIQCQTTDAITAEQGMVESLHIMKEMFITIGVRATYHHIVFLLQVLHSSFWQFIDHTYISVHLSFFNCRMRWIML